ncbi:hypothetical protein HFN89_06990 [Rhizobium laguerreae]|nr:hypothetical protein [Rhizobium laguerreae]
MRISIPFSYRVTAVPFKHKLPSSMAMVENMSVDVPEIDAARLELALVVRDGHGRDIERVYAYGQDFWVKDARGETDLPFLAQHLPAAGQKVPEVRHSHHIAVRRDADELTAATKLLGEVGILRSRTAGIGRWQAREWIVNTPEGFGFVEKTVDSERARNVTESDREARQQRAQRLAHEQTICVAGELYHRVAEPVISSKADIGTKMTWTFGCPDFLTEAGISKYSGYPVSAKDFDRIQDWFDTDAKEVSIDFSFEVVDDKHFKVRADRIALLSSVQRAISDGLTNRNSTPYIAKWCAMRDWYDDLLKGRDGAKLPSHLTMEKREADFDNLAGLLEELGQFGEPRKYGGALDLQGLKMWDGRAVALDLSQTAALQP